MCGTLELEVLWMKKANRATSALLKLALLAGFLVFAGCRDHTQKDATRFQKGTDAYANGDYAAALAKFKPLAERGNAQAQFNLGVMYHQGQGVSQDDKEAAVWWSKAAEQGHAEAQDNLGFRYARGQGIVQDWVQADKWFTIAAAAGNESAMKDKKVIEVHMPPENIVEANTLAQEWLTKHKK
jgi:TPR repeat protein